MKRHIFSLAAFLLAFFGFVLCMGPWYMTSVSTKAIALTKMVGLLTATLAAWLTVGRHGPGDRQRLPWCLLAIGISLYTVGQGVLAFHQVILEERMPFPSWGDPAFVVASALIMAALFVLSISAFRSGLPLGGRRSFWAPAVAVGALFLMGSYPLLAPVLAAGGATSEVFLNLYYPTISFLTLAPCAVVLRVALQFRGGRILLTWLALSLGFGAVFVSDVLFAYLVALDLAWVESVVDLLYMVGYLAVARGMLFQLEMMQA